VLTSDGVGGAASVVVTWNGVACFAVVRDGVGWRIVYWCDVNEYGCGLVWFSRKKHFLTCYVCDVYVISI
jgi:hypothetical protein